MTETVSPIKHAGNLNATSILSTKLFIPQARPSQEVLSRSHLIDRLQSGLSRRLTLISAPAGFGKTTFLAQWIPHSDRGVCWVSLDEADNDLSRFLAYVIAALQMLKAASNPLLIGFCQYEPHVFKLTPGLLISEQDLRQMAERICTSLRQSPMGVMADTATSLLRSYISRFVHLAVDTVGGTHRVKSRASTR